MRLRTIFCLDLPLVDAAGTMIDVLQEVPGPGGVILEVRAHRQDLRIHHGEKHGALEPANAIFS